MFAKFESIASYHFTRFTSFLGFGSFVYVQKGGAAAKPQMWRKKHAPQREKRVYRTPDEILQVCLRNDVHSSEQTVGKFSCAFLFVSKRARTGCLPILVDTIIGQHRS